MTQTPRTFVGSVRCDIRALATLHQHFASQGIVCANVSQLLRATVELARLVVIAKGPAQDFNTAQAVEYLQRYSIGSYGGKGNKNLIEQLKAENYSMPDLGMPVDPELAALVRSFVSQQQAPAVDGETVGVAQAIPEGIPVVD